ncbi:glycosyltransferase family 4 protein [bacterium]|nr:glycosyltransferase family 4 protein [bacterium]
MKIAFLGPAYPLRGGIAQFMAILAKKLQERGHEIKVFSFKKQYPKIIFPGKEQIEKSKMVIDLPIESYLIPYNPLTYNRTVREIIKFQPDLLILKYWIPFFAPAFGYIVSKLKRKSKIKVIYNIDNIDFHEKWVGGDILTKYAFRKADFFITMSDSVDKSLFKLFPKLAKDRVVKINHPTYDFYASEQKNNFEFQYNLLFFGYIKPYKGLDTILEAMPIVLNMIPQLKLTIAGEVYGDDSPYLDIIKKYSLEKNVILHDKYITNEEVKEFFLTADVCVLPYKQATQSGIIQLSYAFGVPVIATAVGGIPEVIQEGKTGSLVLADNPKALAKAILDFYETFDLKESYQYILQENSKYSWQPFIEVIEKL